MAISLGGVQFSISLKTGRTASQIDRVTRSLTALNAASATAGPNLQAIQAALGATAQQASRAGSSSQSASDDIGALTSALGTLASALGATEILGFIKDITLLAGRVQSLRTVLENTGDIAGYSSGELSLIEEKVKKLGITTQAAREIMTRFAQNQLEVADAVKLARIAQDAAVISGVNSSVAADKMATAIFRLDTRMLRNQGILVNLRQEYQAFGLETGRVETSLTATEKQQIALNAVLRAGVRIQGNYEESLKDVYKQFTSLPRYVEEASRSLGEQFLPAFGQVVSLITLGLKTFTEAGQGVKSFTAVVLAMGAGFGTATAAIGAGSLALIAYTKYAKYALGVTAALPSALQLLTAAFTSWQGIVVLAAATAAGAWAYWSAQQAASAEKQRKSIDAVRIAGAKLVQLNESIEYMEQFAGVTKLTAEEQYRLDTEMRKVTDLLPDYSKQLESATKSVDEYLQVLSTIAPGAFKDIGDSLERSRVELQQYDRAVEQSEQRLAKLQPKIIGLSGGGKLGVTRVDNPAYAAEFELLDKLKKKREVVAAENDALEATYNDRSQRRLTQLYQRQDTAVQLALRLRNRLAEAENKYLDERSLEITKDFQSMRDSLVGVQVLEENLAEQERINIAELKKLKKEDNEDTLAFNRRVADVTQSQLAEVAERRKEIELIKEAYSDTARLAALDLGLEEKATRRIRKENELIANGVLPEEARAYAELLDIREQGVAVEEQYAHEISLVNAAIAEQEKLIKSVASTQLARTTAQTKINELGEQIALLERAQEGSRQRRLAEEKKLETQITENRKEETEKRYKDEVEKLKKALEERKDNEKDAAEFIGDKRAALQDRALPGFKAIYDEAKSFSDAILKAGNQQQVKTLQNLFAPAIQDQLQQLASQGAGPEQLQALVVASQRMGESLNLAAQERNRQLAVEDAAMKASQEQIKYLRGIYDTLRGVQPTEDKGSGVFLGSGAGGFDPRVLQGSQPFLGSGSGDFNPASLKGSKPFLGSGSGDFNPADLNGSVPFLAAGTSPFNAATAKSLSGVNTSSEQVSSSLVGLRDSLVDGFVKLSGTLQEQAEFVTTLSQEVREITQSLSTRAKVEDSAIRNRGL